MPTDQNPKQLIVERIKNASNILVTVSRNPSVDELAGALSLTLMLDKMDKAATAVFSGELPKAIDFLEPGKTFEENIDSLRDFIIALDKSKADRLRYKVEDDVVRVFITPYKTTITESDLSFSQGDFNVDLVIALGVEQREDLDTAITAHGRILHDATTVTINTRAGESSLGEVNWTDTAVGGYCEMLMSLSEALQSGLLDQQISTALLTGLVSATDRFRNEKTSPKVMTMAAQLMAAGANQQLIAEKLEAATTVPLGNQPTEKPHEEHADTSAQGQASNDGVMKVDHADDTSLPGDSATLASSIEAANNALGEAEARFNEASARAGTAPSAVVAAPSEQLAPVQPAVVTQELPAVPSQATTVSTGTAREEPSSLISHAKASSWRDAPMPSFGGTLNATTDEAEEDTIREANSDQNRVILSHSDPGDTLAQVTTPTSPINGATLPASEPSVVDIFSQPTPMAPAPQVQPLPVPAQPVDSTMLTSSGISFETTPYPTSTTVADNPTLADLEAEVNRQAELTALAAATGVDDARAAVDAALGVIPAPAPIAPQQQLPPLPDFSTLPPLPGQVAAPEVPPTVPNFGLPDQPVPAVPQVQAPSDPGQFQLPGQG